MKYDSLMGLTPEDYQHPGEVVAMKAMKAIPLFDVVYSKIIGMQVTTFEYPQIAGNHYRITEKTSPRIYGLYKLALSRLGVTEEYPLFSKLEFELNACACGGSNPFIVVNSSFISDCNDGEFLNVIGHEISHIKCGHAIYINMARMLNGLLADMGGIATTAAAALQYAIMEWHRCAEYTCDRAGLIASADIEVAFSQTMKLLGKTDGIDYIDFSTEKVMSQVDDFEGKDSIIDKILYVNLTMQKSHPWSVLRLKQINEWYNSGEYEKVVNKYM